PLVDRAGSVIGVGAAPDSPEVPGPVDFRAPVVVAADGASARLALALGIERDPARQIATAARRYYRSPERSREEYLELWADLRFPAQGPY
ncbi:FAD-dependent oxidoreductase, partial [Streptomyces sp. SID8455]|nr:FAD-dependent oxidoreductase [Streptomyces sp. SID8455]